MSETPEQLVEHFFRHESAKLVSVLTRAFGIGRIELVEDMVQAAMLEAMQAWRQSGVPQRPEAWMHRVAKNRILDALRVEDVHARALSFVGQSEAASSALIDEWLDPEQISDSLLRMIFVCCHPALDRRSQIALTLAVLCGFAVREVASGLLESYEATKKRIQRSKRKLRELGVKVAMPSPDQLGQRLQAVQDVLYVMFNEGYNSSHGVVPIRDEICEEAARLAHLLCSCPLLQAGDMASSSYALLALMLFHSARLDARVDESGDPVLLEDQDRSQWDRRLIGVAEYWFRKASTSSPSRLHFEAAIAQIHCHAPSVADTNWSAIVRLYDGLVNLTGSPIHRLNRAIACGQAGDVQAALSEIDVIRQQPQLESYVLVDCARARLFEMTGDVKSARACLSAALMSKPAPHERRFIEKRLRELAEL